MNARLTPYTEVNTVLDVLLVNIKQVLKEQFVGMYLHGSLASGDFSLDTSDIDFAVVTSSMISADTFLALKTMHEDLLRRKSKWIERLEGSYLSKAAFRAYDATDTTAWPTLNEKHFYQAPHEPHWIIQRHLIREHGIVVHGPAPTSLIDWVQPGDLRNAVIGYLNEWWAPMLTDSSRLQSSEYQAYAILSMCRNLYTLHYGAITSKPKAAQWAQKELGKPWQEPIAQALSWRKGQQLDCLEKAQTLIAYTVEQSKQ
jgi:predicted nucleotidyltransferase